MLEEFTAATCPCKGVLDADSCSHFECDADGRKCACLCSNCNCDCDARRPADGSGWRCRSEGIRRGYIIGSLNAAKLCAPKGVSPGSVIDSVTQELSKRPLGDPAAAGSQQIAALFRGTWQCPPPASDLDNRNDPIDLSHFRAALAAGGTGRRFAQGFIAATVDTNASPYGCNLSPNVSLDQATAIVQTAADDILKAARVLPTSGSTPVTMVIDESLSDAGACR